MSLTIMQYQIVNISKYKTKLDFNINSLISKINLKFKIYTKILKKLINNKILKNININKLLILNKYKINLSLIKIKNFYFYFKVK